MPVIVSMLVIRSVKCRYLLFCEWALTLDPTNIKQPLCYLDTDSKMVCQQHVVTCDRIGMCVGYYANFT